VGEAGGGVTEETAVGLYGPFPKMMQEKNYSIVRVNSCVYVYVL